MAKKKQDKKDGPELHPEVEAYWERLEHKDLGAATITSLVERSLPHIGRVKMAEINAKKLVTPKERKEVERLNAELSEKYPKKGPRYEVIAEKLDMKSRRVRHIVENLHRKK